MKIARLFDFDYNDISMIYINSNMALLSVTNHFIIICNKILDNRARLAHYHTLVYRNTLVYRSLQVENLGKGIHLSFISLQYRNILVIFLVTFQGSTVCEYRRTVRSTFSLMLAKYLKVF